MTICAVIIAGGSGTRLWPLSRTSFPKQFQSITGERTMFQNTLLRLSGINIDSVFVICNEEHKFLAAEQLSQINCDGSIILEPIGRNTAPAIALTALMDNDNSNLLVLPADHEVTDSKNFVKCINDALPLSESGKLVTFGIIPKEAKTGYGYIKRGSQVGPGYFVDSFIEKPNKDKAQSYIDSNDYYWNSGMFLFQSSKYLSELKKYRPKIHESCKKSLLNHDNNSDFIEINHKAFEACPDESIDYAIFEETEDAVVLPMNIGWNDLGSWSSVWEVSDKDGYGNITDGDVILHNTNNSYVRSDRGLIVCNGLNDKIIVSTEDALIVSDKDSDEDIKEIINKMKLDSRSELESHRLVQRPWGNYDSLDQGENHQVKRIVVKPKEKISLQKHHKRSEHWIVVSGVASVTKDEKIFVLKENESTYIPVGVVHSLENKGDQDLVLIEVQYGSYLGEDDIVRYEDRYGRS